VIDPSVRELTDLEIEADATTVAAPQPAAAVSDDAEGRVEALRLALTEQQLRDAQQRLGESQRQLLEMEQLLRELPEIFERKFQQRLEPLRQQQERLLADNHDLRQQLHRLSAGDAGPQAGVRQLPPPRRWFARNSDRRAA
jgi:hypothetical protein